MSGFEWATAPIDVVIDSLRTLSHPAAGRAADLLSESVDARAAWLDKRDCWVSLEGPANWGAIGHGYRIEIEQFATDEPTAEVYGKTPTAAFAAAVHRVAEANS